MHLQAGQAEALCNSDHGCGKTVCPGARVQGRDCRAHWVTQTILRSSDSPCMQPENNRTSIHSILFTGSPAGLRLWYLPIIYSWDASGRRACIHRCMCVRIYVCTEALPDVFQADDRSLGYLASLALAAGRPHMQAPCWCFAHTV